MNKRTPVPGYRLLPSPSMKLKLKDNHYDTPCRNQTWCQTCFLFLESLEIFLNEQKKKIMIDGEYKKQEKFVKIYHRILKVRKDILNKSSTASAPVIQAYLLYTCYVYQCLYEK